MNVSQALADIKAFVESDPLIAAASNLSVPASTRQVLADHLLAVEADAAQVTQAAVDEAVAAATAGLDPQPEQPQ